jgi:hypothetical protein
LLTKQFAQISNGAMALLSALVHEERSRHSNVELVPSPVQLSIRFRTSLIQVIATIHTFD